MADASTVPVHYVTGFTNNIEHLLQTEGSLLEPYVQVELYEGEAAQVVDQFGVTRARRDLQRDDDTPNMNVPRDARWIYPTDIDWGTRLERKDQLRQMINPKSPLVQAGTWAIGREIDDVIINDGIFGVNMTGRKGATPVAFPSSQAIAVDVGGGGSPTGLNTEKLIRANEKLFGASINPRARKYMIITEKQNSDLLRETKVTSSDYNGGDRPVLKEGIVQYFMGWNFIMIPSDAMLIPVNGSGHRRCVGWIENGIVLGKWNGLFSRAAEHPGKKFNVQIYLAQAVGATRKQEKQIVEVPCLET